MAERGNRIRVILRWIQIKDNKEAAWDDEGEFRFRSRVTTGGHTTESQFPEHGFWSISDHPRRNKVDKIDRVLFEGEPGDRLVVELFGEELDQFSASDHLEDYRKEFIGEPSTWLGRCQPNDEFGGDPEDMSDWRICYDIETA